ncbi:hypothetical protein MBLNU230_g4552t1 [Neophaeotheca triangularis]
MKSAPPDEDPPSDPITTLLTAYSELNPSHVDELSFWPTPLEFMRYVAKNRPFIVRRAAADWPAVQDWNAAHLLETLGSHPVNVSITPHGNADAIVPNPPDNNGAIFVEPHEETEPFDQFLSYVQNQARQPPASPDRGNVKYAQTQNDNLRDEYSSLFTSVPATVDFATEALAQPPDAINFWLGNRHSTTALHKDNYENIYVQIRGTKTFTLLPPIAQACVNEAQVRTGRYVPSVPTTNTNTNTTLSIQPSTPTSTIPQTPLWDPTFPTSNPTPYTPLASAVTLNPTLREGDLLYLPALWYHHVTQTEGDEGFSCSVNYWYDMEFSGSFWAGMGFVRDVGEAGRVQGGK